MAEFTDVMKQMKRMCKAHESCRECLMPRQNKEYSCPLYSANSEVCDVEKVERIVMDWAAAHPEPRFPSWGDVWRQLFPDASNAPCPLHFVPAHMVNEYCISPRQCAICRQQQIPADIAKKLGIKPIGGESDENA